MQEGKHVYLRQSRKVGNPGSFIKTINVSVVPVVLRFETYTGPTLISTWMSKSVQTGSSTRTVPSFSLCYPRLPMREQEVYGPSTSEIPRILYSTSLYTHSLDTQDDYWSRQWNTLSWGDPESEDDTLFLRTDSNP